MDNHNDMFPLSDSSEKVPHILKILQTTLKSNVKMTPKLLKHDP